MTAQEYIDTYHMEAVKSSEFQHRDFIRGYGQEFESKVYPGMPYPKFRKVVADMDAKFKEILALKQRKGRLSNKWWKAFYAIYVVPKRRELFPEKQARIEKLKDEQSHN